MSRTRDLVHAANALGQPAFVFTGLTRDSRQILNEQQQSIAQKMAMLDEVAQMVDNAWDALAQGDPDRVGAMLDEAWQRKKRFAQGVSTPLIDAMYGAARQAGALGGKILGAGGGGFLLVYAAKDNTAGRARSAQPIPRDTFLFR